MISCALQNKLNPYTQCALAAQASLILHISLVLALFFLLKFPFFSPPPLLFSLLLLSLSHTQLNIERGTIFLMTQMQVEVSGDGECVEA